MIPLAWVLDFVIAQWRPIAALWVTFIMLIVWSVRYTERHR